jgi:hypothetical protein
VETIRQVNRSGKIETDIRYFLSSSADHPECLATAIRRPGGIGLISLGAVPLAVSPQKLGILGLCRRG